MRRSPRRRRDGRTPDSTGQGRTASQQARIDAARADLQQAGNEAARACAGN